MSSSEYITCFYCSEYTKLAKDYPVNFASMDEKSFTPRCFLHWKYGCNQCVKLIHFNGISWCSDCKEFTCLSCVEEKMVKKNFLIYDYYYNIPCKKCGKMNPGLDFAEYEGIHPYQTGEIIPSEDIVVWMPIHPEEAEVKEFPHPAWGFQRIMKIGKISDFQRLESLEEYDPKKVWDELAPTWGANWPEGGDFNHKYMILPSLYKMIDVESGDKILDVACGEGTTSRYLAKNGAIVTAIDVSDMITYATKKEEKDKLGIKYLKLNAEKIIGKFGEEAFDKVVCNMALHDINDYKTTIEQISKVLKKDGLFVFSITHPCFAWPTTTSLRVPKDSQRNEDKIRVIFDYFDERPVLIKYGKVFAPLLHFPRKVSDYISVLVKNKLIIEEMSEPKPSENLVTEFPRHTYMDYELHPHFMVIKSRKI